MWSKQVAATKQTDGYGTDQHNGGRVQPAILVWIRRGDLGEAQVQDEGQDVRSHATQTSLLSPSQRRRPPWKALRLSPMRAPGGSRFRSFALPPPSTTLSAISAACRRATTSSTAFCHFFLPRRFKPRKPRLSSNVR